MSEHVKAALSAVVIVACLGLLGLMVYLKVDGAAVGALGTITVIIAWLTRAPTNPTPPGATLIPFVAAGALMVSLLACGCSAAQKQAENDLGKDVAKESAECLTSCGVRKVLQGNMSDPGKAAEGCAVECGIDLITNPKAINDVVRIMAGAQAGVAAARRPDAGTDAGK